MKRRMMRAMQSNDLEPDTVQGMKYLEAVREVFGAGKK